MSNYEIVGFQHGGLSALSSLQAAYYAKHWGLDHLYESVITKGVSEFLQRYHPDNDFVRLVLLDGQFFGGITIDSHDGIVGQLRWFIVSEKLHGLGLGKKLIDEAMEFVKHKGFEKIYLTTVSGFDAARKLYDLHGFNVVAEKLDTTWGKPMTEQRMEWRRGY